MVVAITDESYRRALSDGDAKLVGQQPHDGRGLDPGQVFELGAAFAERDEENVAPHVAAEDAEESGLGHFGVAEDLDVF